MFLEKIVLEGFKSYAQRTEVGPFDRQFNAITGENGSGKSNILDAICFVLGISLLQQVRVGSLQELVYKQGTAGIQKATVTLIFNNDDPETAPPAYKSCDQITVTRQVVIGGKNKYLINGHVQQLSTVQNLFHSVSLNVNNPHFLIMQGRITKVLNMKPAEILGMIEEAAGTRMFETKKEAAIKTIEKKEQKVQEINAVIAGDIQPQLEKLRSDRSIYLEHQQHQTEIEALSRFLTAVTFHELEQLANSSNKEVTELESSIRTTTEDQRSRVSEQQQIKRQVAALTEKKAKSLSKTFKENEEKAATLSKQVVKENATFLNTSENVESDRKTLAKLKQQLTEAFASLETKKGEHVGAEAAATEARAACAKALESVEALQRHAQRAEAGIEDDESGQTLTEQLLAAKAACNAASVTMQEADMKIAHLKSSLTEAKKGMKGAEKEHAKMIKELQDVEAELKTITAEMTKLTQVCQEEERLSATHKTTKTAVLELRERVEALAARASSVDFQYRDPVEGFDRSRVLGMVAALVEVKNPIHATALEVAAAGKLYNVVVDTEETSTLLLTKGATKRITVIPLTKIVAAPISDKLMTEAHKLVGKDRAFSAMSLLKYNKDVAPAVAFAFGNTMICADSEAAKQICFSPATRCRCVTLEGDVFDPSGTVTGGSRPSNSGVLLQIAELSRLRNELASSEDALSKIESQIKRVQGAAEKQASLQRQHDLAAHKGEIVRSRMQQGASAQSIRECEQMEAEIKQLEETKEKAKESEKAAKQQSSAIEKSMASAEKTKSEGAKEIQKKLSAARKTHTIAQKEQKTKEQVADRLSMEIESLQNEVASLEEQITTSTKSLAAAEKDVEKMNVSLTAIKAKYSELQAMVDAEKAKMIAADTELNQLNSEHERLGKEHSEADLELKKLESKLARLQKDQKDAAVRVKEMQKQHPWIAQEKQYFGKAGTEYDFAAKKPADVSNRKKKLEEQNEKIAKKLNKKVMSMFEKAEEEFKELMNKKAIIEKDKQKIEDVIRELEEKKNEALQKTWVKVNRDFGSIFSTLLPGTTAKLSPPSGASVLDGLEVKVAFGGVWKDSLSELSGGQRSLLALSLVLSLLLFKPAPFYLLDEVDAALDLSHTQNIGKMLRTHFSHSQFIVISLKDGMFNNANVLFRTQFLDGISTVMRTTPGLGGATSSHAPKKLSMAPRPSVAPKIVEMRSQEEPSTSEDSGDKENGALAPSGKVAGGRARKRAALSPNDDVSA